MSVRSGGWVGGGRRGGWLAGLACVVVLAAVSPRVQAQSAPDVSGEWDAAYVSPLGPQELKIYLTQEGPRISGHTTSEFGEFQVRGSINGNDVRFSWSEVDGGKTVEIAVTGKIEGDTITGTAKIGDRGQGAFKADRTSGS